MKRTLFALFFLIFSVGITVPNTSHATYLIYRWRYQQLDPKCWNYTLYYPGGQGGGTAVQAYATITINPGDMMAVFIKAGCCSASSFQTGTTWQESSADGGVTWNPVAGTNGPFSMPPYAWGEMFATGTNGNLVPYQTLENCMH